MAAEIDPAIPNNKYSYLAPIVSTDFSIPFGDSKQYKSAAPNDRSSSVASSNALSQTTSVSPNSSRSSSGNYSITSGKALPIYYKNGMNMDTPLPQDSQQHYSPIINIPSYNNGSSNMFQSGINPAQDSHQYLSSMQSNPGMVSNNQNSTYLYGNSPLNYGSQSLDNADMFNRMSQPHQEHAYSQNPSTYRDVMGILSSQDTKQTPSQNIPSMVQYHSKAFLENYSPTIMPGASSNYGFSYGMPGTATLNNKLISNNHHLYGEPKTATAPYDADYSYSHQNLSPMYKSTGTGMQMFQPNTAAGNFVPLQVGVWDSRATDNNSCQPYKPLMLIPTESLERSILTRLSCKDNANEYSPIFKSDSRFSNSISSQSKITRIEKLLRTGGTTRLYHPPGLNNGIPGEVPPASGPVGKHTTTGQDILEKCIAAIYSALGSEEDFSTYLSSITDSGIVEAGREPSRGIKEQLDVPEGVSLIMDARHKEEIQQTFMKWTSNRPKTENFFRMEDKKGLSFSLEELKEALDIIMSRPPRRINNYVARQLLTDATYGQGRGVTEFSSNQITSLHSLSYKTRQPCGLAPAGSALYTSPEGSQDIVQSVHYTISQDDIPFVNSKKSNKYDPHYCRRQGIYKEGWCGYCKMGGWYLMKNSGYLYHQNHEHGIFPGGYTFEDPLVIRRKVIRETRWEGLCGICYHWIDLDHTDRKLWGTWYRHYKLCVNEYEEIKKLLRSTSAPIELVEIKYRLS